MVCGTLEFSHREIVKVVNITAITASEVHTIPYLIIGFEFGFVYLLMILNDFTRDRRFWA